MDIADKIKFLRKEFLKMNQTTFSKIIGVSRGTIINWENGISQPTMSHIAMIAQITNVTIDYLVDKNKKLELSVVGINDEEYIILKELISYFESENKR
ncbi:helix-turn-helix transcriptional regulator [Thomasclavelia sp.]|uniref:helix-turn-helix domain-containing protein n=1 Tax=Thomasclavelia sp. TaxID=3025757 RepID=UPI0025DEC71B|nr:helix-turn-helix transcriptional regulator [Thomasclavelia sp.]